MAGMNLEKISMWLVAIGATNWGLDQLGFNVVDMVAEATVPVVGTVIYWAVGLSGVWMLAKLAGIRK